jgi:hypothetical protein
MDAFLRQCKALIEEDNLEELYAVYLEHKDENYPWEYVYQKLYLHACLKKKPQIAEFMKGLFSQFDPIQQIGIRQMFSYGNYLLRK